jgi:hypothetical protein
MHPRTRELLDYLDQQRAGLRAAYSTLTDLADLIQPTGLRADAAWAAIERAGTALREAVTAADGLALGGVSWPHPRFGPLTAYHWIALCGAHEARHAAQICEIADTLGR